MRHRVVKRAMTRLKATEVRHRIEEAQSVVAASSGGVGRKRAQAVLDEYGVGQHDVVTQSQHRVARFWRVYADPQR